MDRGDLRATLGFVGICGGSRELVGDLGRSRGLVGVRGGSQVIARVRGDSRESFLISIFSK